MTSLIHEWLNRKNIRTFLDYSDYEHASLPPYGYLAVPTMAPHPRKIAF